MKEVIPRGLVVSCQALKHEPLYGGSTIAKMAEAARQGGAVGIRANTVRDINAINRRIEGKLPIIGLIKRDYADSAVYITPTRKEVKALIGASCAVIAMDADKALMADIATFEEAKNAERLGFDYISTTLRSYTEETRGIAIPDVGFCRRLKEEIASATVVAEGGIHSFMELKSILDAGIEHVIIGGAITRPQNITSYFVDIFNQSPAFGGEERIQA